MQSCRTPARAGIVQRARAWGCRAMLAWLAAVPPSALPEGVAPEDPLRSSACTDALAVLDQARQSASRGEAGVGPVEAARISAAQACLGSGRAPLRPGRPLQPLPRAAAPALDGPHAPAPPPVTAIPLPPVAVPRPSILSHCDAAGCWTTDGDHLRFIPVPALPPAMPCALVGVNLHCP